MERVFVICHGCRRCVSLCQSFPTLFDLVDNAVNGTQTMRKQMDSFLNVHPDAWMPSLADQRVPWGRTMNNTTHLAVNGQRTPGKVALFATCDVNHNEPGIGADLVRPLDHSQIPYKIVSKLARLIGVEDRLFVEAEGHARVYAIADEDLERKNAERTSAVHFARFEFSTAQRSAIRAVAGVKVGCDHHNYPAHVAAAAETFARLACDLKS